MPENNITNTTPKQKKQKPLQGEKAISTIYVDNIFVNEDRYDTQFGSQVQKYSLISRNPIVKTALDTVARGVFWPSYSVKSNPENNLIENPDFKELDDEIIPFVRDQLSRLGEEIQTPPNVHKSPSFQEFLEASLHSGRVYGFAVSEMIWDSTDGNWRLKKLKSKPSWNFDFEIDKLDELKYVLHESDINYKLRPERFIVGTYPNLQNGNYYGVSDLQCIEHDVKALERLEVALLQGGAYNSYKPLIAHLSMNMKKPERQSAIDAINALKASAIAIFPKSFDQEQKLQNNVEFEVLDDRASQDAIENLWNIVNELIKRINRALGLPDDLGQVTANIGSFARAKTQFNMYVATVNKCQLWLESIANRIVKSIIYYNWESLPEEYLLPRWSFDTIEEEYDTEKAIFYKTLIESGIIEPDEQFIRESLEFPPMDKNDEIGMEEQKPGEQMELPFTDTEIVENLDDEPL